MAHTGKEQPIALIPQTGVDSARAAGFMKPLHFATARCCSGRDAAKMILDDAISLMMERSGKGVAWFPMKGIQTIIRKPKQKKAL